MPELKTTSASLRIVDENKRSIFSVNSVAPTVSAATAAGFVNAIEKLYNNGECNASINIVMNLQR